MGNRRTARLVIDDEELVALLRQAEEVLLVLADAEESSSTEPKPWHLPEPIADRKTLAALDRVREALATELHSLNPEHLGPRLLRPDGVNYYELVPLRLVEIDQTDMETLTEARDVINHALSGTGALDPARSSLDDLAEVLSFVTVDVTLWPQDAQPSEASDLIRPLARLVAVLDMPGDDDTALLIRAIAGAGGITLVLNPEQDAAYQRVVSRMVLLMIDVRPEHRWLY